MNKIEHVMENKESFRQYFEETFDGYSFDEIDEECVIQLSCPSDFGLADSEECDESTFNGLLCDKCWNEKIERKGEK